MATAPLAFLSNVHISLTFYCVQNTPTSLRMHSFLIFSVLITPYSYVSRSPLSLLLTFLHFYSLFSKVVECNTPDYCFATLSFAVLCLISSSLLPLPEISFSEYLYVLQHFTTLPSSITKCLHFVPPTTIYPILSKFIC